jgi:hypothetical protein
VEIAAKAAGFNAHTYTQAAEVCKRAEAGEEAAQEALATMDRTGVVQAAWRKLNDVPPPPKPPIALDTEHQRTRAEARRARLAKGIYGLQGMCDGFAATDLRYVVAVATAEELGEWDRILKGAVTTLGELRRDLKNEGSVA